MTHQRTALGDLEQTLKQPHSRRHNAEQVLMQNKIFLACLAASQGQPFSVIRDAAKAAYETVSNQRWDQTAHEKFLCILLDSGYVHINRDMLPELRSEVFNISPQPAS